MLIALHTASRMSEFDCDASSAAVKRAAAWLRRSVLAWFVLLLVSAGFAGAAWGQGVDLTNLKVQRAEDALQLNFATKFELPRGAEDALLKGVPLYFVAEATLYRSRWYWRDVRVNHISRTWRLAWQPLTRQYRVSFGGLHQSYPDLAEALGSIRSVNAWRLAELSQIDDDVKHYLEFSYELDTSQLPRPMQIGLGTPQGWTLRVERSVSLGTEPGK